MNTVNFILNERSQTEKVTFVWFLLYGISQIGRSIETESKLVGRKLTRGNEEWLFNGNGVFFCGGRKV